MEKNLSAHCHNCPYSEVVETLKSGENVFICARFPPPSNMKYEDIVSENEVSESVFIYGPIVSENWVCGEHPNFFEVTE